MGTSTVHVAVYADEFWSLVIIMMRLSASRLAFLHSTFQIKDLGFLNRFLGMDITENSTGRIMTPQKFATGLLNELNGSTIPSTTCPLPTHLQLNRNNSPVLNYALLYRQLVGKLNYLTHTQPDLAFAVQYLNRSVGLCKILSINMSTRLTEKQIYQLLSVFMLTHTNINMRKS